MEKARVQQMQDSVFDAADVLVNRQPVVGLFAVQHALVIVGTGEPGVIPGRLYEGVKGIGFPLASHPSQIKLPPARIGLDG